MSKHLYNSITSIRNSYKVGKESCIVKNTKLNRKILDILTSRSYIKEFKVLSEKEIQIFLAYSTEFIKGKKVQIPHLFSIDAISKPSFRKYLTVKEIKSNLAKYNMNYLVSTSKDIMFGDQCIKGNIGGEVLFSLV
jgi:ribosomal protein S8